MTNEKTIGLLRDRVRALEAENADLKSRLDEARRSVAQAHARIASPWPPHGYRLNEQGVAYRAP
jgi:hypothetical protein